jgi:hypothetical protein
MANLKYTLILILDKIKESILNNELTENQQYYLSQILLLWYNNDMEDRNMIEYLFTGWWIKSSLVTN